MSKARSLGNRYEDSYNSREGGSKNSVLTFPRGTEFFKPEENKVSSINIIPYVIKTKNHPLVKAGKAKVGDLDYILDVWVHRYIGPGKDDIICPKKTFNGMCPICDQASEYYNEGKEKEYSNLKAKRRAFYNVIDTNDPDKGLQVFDTSHALFEAELIVEARDAADGGPIIPFADIDGGSIVSFKAFKKSLGTQSFLAFKNFQFKDRAKALKDSLIDKAISFDEIMTVLSTEEIEQKLFGAMESDEDDDDEKPASGRRAKPTEDDDDDDEPAPARSRSKPVAEPEDDEDGLMEDEPEDEPAPASARTSAGKCPAGGRFGKDCDALDECDDCPATTWKACNKASKA